jgi:hypothetical protein
MKAQVDRPKRKIINPEQLATEIIKQAAKDLNGVGGDNHVPQWCKDSAITFFGSPWFETLCDILNTDPDLIRKRIKSK